MPMNEIAINDGKKYCAVVNMDIKTINEYKNTIKQLSKNLSLLSK